MTMVTVTTYYNYVITSDKLEPVYNIQLDTKYWLSSVLFQEQWKRLPSSV